MTTDMITFEYEGSQVAFDPAEKMWNLTAMHRAAGGISHKRPSEWLQQAQTRELLDALAEEEKLAGIPASLAPETVCLAHSFVVTREGRNGGTWAHWQIAAAYSHYLDARFYLQWNRWAMERAQQIADGEGAAPLARVAALEERVSALEATPRRRVPRPSRCVNEVLAALHALGGVAHVYELRRALPHVCYSTLRVRLQRMRDRGLLQQPVAGVYALVAPIHVA